MGSRTLLPTPVAIFFALIMLTSGGHAQIGATPPPALATSYVASGTWVGKLLQGQSSFPTLLEIQQTGDDISGFSAQQFDSRSVALGLIGKNSNGSMKLQETEVDQTTGPPLEPGKAWCLKTMRLDFNTDDSLSGSWIATNCVSGAARLSGTIELKRAATDQARNSASTSPSGATSFATPMIATVSPIAAIATQNIVISGRGFGTQLPYTNLDSDFIRLEHSSPLWHAGSTRDNLTDFVTLSVASWTDRQIIISGFSGQYGSNNWRLVAGSQITIQIWNAQTGAGPSVKSVTVASSPIGGTAQNGGAITSAQPPRPGTAQISPAEAAERFIGTIQLLCALTGGAACQPGNPDQPLSQPPDQGDSEWMRNNGMDTTRSPDDQ